MLIGQQTKDGEVVYVRDRYYVVKKPSTVYADMYLVFHEGYWRSVHIEGDAFGTAKDNCIDWISKRRCYN